MLQVSRPGQPGPAEHIRHHSPPHQSMIWQQLWCLSFSCAEELVLSLNSDRPLLNGTSFEYALVRVPETVRHLVLPSAPSYFVIDESESAASLDYDIRIRLEKEQKRFEPNFLGLNQRQCLPMTEGRKVMGCAIRFTNSKPETNEIIVYGNCETRGGDERDSPGATVGIRVEIVGSLAKRLETIVRRKELRDPAVLMLADDVVDKDEPVVQVIGREELREEDNIDPDTDSVLMLVKCYGDKKKHRIDGESPGSKPVGRHRPLHPWESEYTRVPFVDEKSFHQLFPEIVNASGETAGVLGHILAYLDCVEMVSSMAKVNTVFEKAVELSLCHERKFSAREYNWILSTGIGGKLLLQILKLNKTFEFERAQELLFQSCCRHGYLSSQEMVEVLLEKCDLSTGNWGCLDDLASSLPDPHCKKLLIRLLENPKVDATNAGSFQAFAISLTRCGPEVLTAFLKKSRESFKADLVALMKSSSLL